MGKVEVKQRQLLGTYQQKIFQLKEFWLEVQRFMDYYGSDEAWISPFYNSMVPATQKTIHLDLFCINHEGSICSLFGYPAKQKVEQYLNIEFLHLPYPTMKFNKITSIQNFEQFIEYIENSQFYTILLEMKSGSVEDCTEKYS